MFTNFLSSLGQLTRLAFISSLLSLAVPAAAQNLSDAEDDWIDKAVGTAFSVTEALNSRFEDMPTLVTDLRRETTKLEAPKCGRVAALDHRPDGQDGDNFAGFVCALEFETQQAVPSVTTMEANLQNHSFVIPGDGTSFQVRLFGPSVPQCPDQRCKLLSSTGDARQPHAMQFMTQVWLMINGIGRELTGDNTLEVMTRRDLLFHFDAAMKVFREDEGFKAFMADPAASTPGSGDPRHIIFRGQMAKRFTFTERDACQVGISFAGDFYLFCRAPSFLDG